MNCIETEHPYSTVGVGWSNGEACSKQTFVLLQYV